MAQLWKCPKDDCPATEFPPLDATTFADEERVSLCGGDCGQTYPVHAFRVVRG